MKVIVSSLGRFHAFDLAKQLQRKGYLQHLYTAYPYFKIEKSLRPYSYSFPWFFCITSLFTRLGCHYVTYHLNWFTIETFDQWVARHITPCDVFVHLSQFGLYSAHRAKQMGARVVCDRGSSHIVYQNELLAEEYALWGIPYIPIDSRIIEKELQEYENADLIVVPSSFAYRSFLEKGIPKHKLVKIPYGVDLSLFHPSPKQDDIFRVIYVGTMSLQKGVHYLLEALAPCRLPKFELVLIGKMLPEIKPWFAKYEGHFRYLGFIPRIKLYHYYSQASVFVLASIQEGLALVIAQAMACGLPVIATTNSGAEDLFTNGIEGFIVPIRDSEAIREKVLYLYKHPDVREEMAQAALKRVRQLRGWDTYGETYIRVLEGLIK